jgi:geranylgeranyl pyrophosphate synthase
MADDILNSTSTDEQIGKPAGSDQAQGKVTCVSVFGLDSARSKAERLVENAVEALRNLKGNIEPLTALAHYIVERTM